MHVSEPKLQDVPLRSRSFIYKENQKFDQKKIYFFKFRTSNEIFKKKLSENQGLTTIEYNVIEQKREKNQTVFSLKYKLFDIKSEEKFNLRSFCDKKRKGLKYFELFFKGLPIKEYSVCVPLVNFCIEKNEIMFNKIEKRNKLNTVELKESLIDKLKELCFFIPNKKDKDIFLQTLMIPILKFNLKSTLCWNKDINNSIQKINTDESSFISDCNYDSIQNDFKIPMKNEVLDEIFSPIFIDNKFNLLKKEFFSESKEEPLNVPSLSRYLLVNSKYFDNDDIDNFATLFKNIKCQSLKLEDNIIMNYNNDILFLLYITNNDNVFEFLLRNEISSFKDIIIISSVEPILIQSNLIKWRYITSTLHISRVVLPFLLEND